MSSQPASEYEKALASASGFSRALKKPVAERSLWDALTQPQPQPRTLLHALTGLPDVWDRATLVPMETNRQTGERRLAAPQAAMDLLSALMLPGDVAQGKVDMGQPGQFSPEAMQAATNAAVNLGITGGALPKPSNALGIFGGELAKTADKAALATAKEMAAQGASKDAIWNQTGWFTGADGKWRFEIPDNAALLDVSAIPKAPSRLDLADQYLKDQGRTEKFPLGDPRVPEELQNEALMWADLSGKLEAPSVNLDKVLSHKAFFDAYPELSKLATAQSTDQNLHGSFSVTGDLMKIATRPNMIASETFNPKSTALHESQHAVQRIENFAKGGSPGQEWPMLPDFNDIADARVMASFVDRGTPIENAAAAFLNATGRDASGAARELLRQYADDPSALYSLPASAKEAYKALAGEVEARNVQARMNMTPEERKAKAPWTTQDIPNERQIVTFW